MVEVLTALEADELLRRQVLDLRRRGPCVVI
jgi:hypothetical protein